VSGLGQTPAAQGGGQVPSAAGLHSFLRAWPWWTPGAIADATKARELCAGLRAGEIVLFDKAYVDFPHLADLHTRGVFFVSRCLERFLIAWCNGCTRRTTPRAPRRTRGAADRAHPPQLPGPLRRVEMVVEVDGQPTVMSFLTNHLTWAATSVADLYRCRWQIEVLLQATQTNHAKWPTSSATPPTPVKWQVWMALLVQLLVRFHAWQSRWGHSFTRLFTYVRAALWLDRDLAALLPPLWTADGHFRCLGQPPRRGCLVFSRTYGQHATV